MPKVNSGKPATTLQRQAGSGQHAANHTKAGKDHGAGGGAKQRHGPALALVAGMRRVARASYIQQCTRARARCSACAFNVDDVREWNEAIRPLVK